MRRSLLLPLAFALLVVSPRAAHGHAAFLSARPEPGAELTSAPGTVVLSFTEPLNVKLSRASVVDPGGARFVGRAEGEREIVVAPRTNAPGVYSVDWTTVSTLDGHTLRGSFRFGVGVKPGEGAEGTTALAPQGAELGVSVARAAEYAALLLALGLLLLGRLSRGLPQAPATGPRLARAVAAALFAGVAVVAGEAVIAADAPGLAALLAYIGTGLPGVARTSRLALEAAALVAALAGARGGVLAGVGGAVVALSAAGHAAAVRPPWWGIGVDAVHLLAAGLWAGGILALAVSRPPGGWRGDEGRALLGRFSPVAIPAFLVTVAFGILRGVQELSGLGDLVSSSYGQVLSFKILAVLAMVPLSVLGWRRVTGSTRAEAGLALVVVAAAALLAAYPLPPGRASESEEEERKASEAASAVPKAGDLSMGGGVGDVLVGLTLRPAQPGRNQALVHLMPVTGDASRVSAELFVDGRISPLERCGPPCRRTELTLRGGERMEVRVAGKKGGVAEFDLPALPAPDAAPQLEGIQARMHALVSYRFEELLAPPYPPIRTNYDLRAPDRIRIESSNGLAIVSVGDRQYRKDRLSGSWTAQESPVIDVPFFIWDSKPFVSPKVLGAGKAEGVDAQVVSFFQGSAESPIWFRLWIDSQSLVRKAEMRAVGHFMDHRYFDFDGPVTIDPPV